MILAMAAVVTVVAAAVVCRYELAAAGSSSWKLEPAGGSGSARYWDSWNSSTAEAAVWRAISEAEAHPGCRSELL